jgi:hypothetical protein
MGTIVSAADRSGYADRHGVLRPCLAKKSPAEKAAEVVAPAEVEHEFALDDVVFLVSADGSTSVLGREYRVLNFGRYCVNFAGIGCKRAPGSALRLVPAGSEAQPCSGCSNR